METPPDTAQKSLVFSGEFHPLLDQKKRLTIPARWRPDGRLDEVYIIKSLGRGCLVAMTQDVLQSLGSNAQAKSPTTADHSAFQDTLFANAVICPIDSQGRMVLPDELCRFAGIEKEAVLTGAGEKFNIWNPAGWQRFQESVAPTYATILKSLGL